MEDIISVKLSIQIVLIFIGIITTTLLTMGSTWGSLVGLFSQPFWMITSYHDEQWAVFILGFINIAVFSRGVYKNLYKKPAPTKPAFKPVLLFK